MFGVTAADSATFAGMAALLALVSLGGVLHSCSSRNPARRARGDSTRRTAQAL